MAAQIEKLSWMLENEIRNFSEFYKEEYGFAGKWTLEEDFDRRLDALEEASMGTSGLVIIDDVESPPLTPEEREKVLSWYQEAIDDENLDVHTITYPGGSFTTIKPKEHE